MIRGARIAAFALALIAPALARAQPAPRLDLSRCRAFDDAEARRAIAAELTEVPADRQPHLPDVAVSIDCPDAITATIHVQPAPPDGPLEKTLDLGDLPGELRLRTVALAVAELVDVAVTTLSSATAASARPPPPTRPPGHDEGGVDARPFGERVASAAPPSAAVAVHLAAPRPPLLERRGLVGGDTLGAHGVSRAGFRVYSGDGAPMLDVALAAARGPFVADLFVATRSGADALGHVRATVGGLGLAATFACRGGNGTYLCAGARGAIGVAAVSATPVHPMIVAEDIVTTYAELGPRVEVRVEHRRWSGSLIAGIAWSSGVVALAEDREVARLAGTVISASFGLGWGP